MVFILEINNKTDIYLNDIREFGLEEKCVSETRSDAVNPT